MKSFDNTQSWFEHGEEEDHLVEVQGEVYAEEPRRGMFSAFAAWVKALFR